MKLLSILLATFERGFQRSFVGSHHFFLVAPAARIDDYAVERPAPAWSRRSSWLAAWGTTGRQRALIPALKAPQSRFNNGGQAPAGDHLRIDGFMTTSLTVTATSSSTLTPA